MIILKLIENFINYIDSSESLSLELKFLLKEKANVDQQNSELTKTLQAKEMEIESLIQNRERYNVLF